MDCLSHLAAASVASVIAMAEGGVAVALGVAGREVGLVGRLGVEGTVVVVHTARGHLVATGARNAVVVATARLASGTDETLATGGLATTHVDGVITPAETHITAPGVAVGASLLEAGAGVEVAVVVVETTSSHGVATGETDITDTGTTEAQGASGARKSAEVGLASTVVAGKTTGAEASVATEVVAFGHGLLESTELIPGAVVVDHTTSEHGVATGRDSTDDTGVVRAL